VLLGTPPGEGVRLELRLQEEIRPDFTIDEPGSDAARATFLTDRHDEAAELLASEMRRRSEGLG